MIRRRGRGARIARMRSSLVALLAALSLQAAAAPFTASVGPERVVLDAIPGMSDALPLGSPRLIELAESIASPSDRILLFALTDLDLRRFQQGDRIDLRRYLLLVTPKSLERERVGPEPFRALVADLRRDIGKPTQPGDLRQALEGQPEGRTVALQLLKDTDRVYSIMAGSRLPGAGGGWFSRPSSQYVLSTSTALTLRDKAFTLTVNTLFESSQDAEWLRLATERWVEVLQKLNAR